MMSTREDLPLVSLTSQYSSCYYRWATNFLERGRAELRRIPIPRTPVNRPSPEMRQASSAGNISGATAHSEGRGSSGRRRRSVPTEEENKASFKRYLEEAWNQSNLEVVDEIFDRYISHQPDGSVLERGPQDVKRFVSEFRSAFPDLRMNIEEQIAEGDKVMSRGTIRGTHQGEFRGMAPTGEEMKIPGTAVFRFSSEGKVVESWDSYDQLSLMRQNIEQELRVARSIQQALLPQGLPQLEGWQITPCYQPAREVGGDFYDFHLLSEGRLGLVIGDATEIGRAHV